MAAASTDKLRKLSRKWVGQIGAAGVSDAVVTTIPLASTTNLATDTAVTIVVDRVDSSGTKTPSLEETIVGVVSGSNIVTSLRGVEGTAQAHLAGAVVEVLVTADGYNDIIDHLLVSHLQSGAHAGSSISASMIAASGVIPGNLAASSVLSGNLAASSVLAGNIGFDLVTASSTTTFLNKTIGDTLTMTTGAINSTASDIVLTPGTSKLVKFANLRHDNTTNTYKNNTVIVTGWGFVLGDNSTAATVTKTVDIGGLTFTEAPVITIATLGYKDSSDPSTISDFSQTAAYVASAGSISTTQFIAQAYNIGGGSISNTRRVGFSWTAIGTI
jgi:hypothetical protein